MSACRKWRGQLVEAVYGELDGARRAAFEQHLADCAGCAEELATLEATAARVAEALPPRPHVDAWSRLRPALDALDQAPRPARLRLSYAAAAVLAAALVVLGVGLGALLRPPVPPLTPDAAVARSGADVDAELGRYLERATPLLLAIANRGGAGEASYDPAVERRLAARLAADAADLRRDLEGRGRRRSAALVSELELVFLQISNLPEGEYVRGVEMVRATIDDRALLFQLSVEEMRRLAGPQA